jgi:DNA-binding Xre family transcriptional regulator
MSSDKQRSINVRSNLFALKRQLELQAGRAYTWREIAEASDLTPNTVYGLARNENRGIQFDTMEKLMGFFRKEGLNIEVGDLFLVEEAA